MFGSRSLSQLSLLRAILGLFQDNGSAWLFVYCFRTMRRLLPNLLLESCSFIFHQPAFRKATARFFRPPVKINALCKGILSHGVGESSELALEANTAPAPPVPAVAAPSTPHTHKCDICYLNSWIWGVGGAFPAVGSSGLELRDLREGRAARGSSRRVYLRPCLLCLWCLQSNWRCAAAAPRNSNSKACPSNPVSEDSIIWF